MQRFLFLSLAFVFVLTGCDSAGSSGGGNPDSSPEAGEDFTYSKDAEPVDLGTVSVAEKSDSKIVFETSGSDVDIQEGEVIVSDVPENELRMAPRFLRKVQSVQRKDGQVTVTTEQAALTDAVKKASLDFSNSLTGSPKRGGASRWKVASTAKGVKATSCEDVQLQDVDLAAAEDDITAGLTNGTISFCPDLTGNIDISGFSIDKFSTVASGEITYNTDLSAATSKSIESSGAKELATFETYGVVGPVQYTMELSLVAGYEAQAKGNAQVTAGLESGGSLTLGAQYEEGSWIPVSDQGLSFNSRPVEWERNASMSVKGYIRPEVTVFIYETAGPSLSVGPYVELAANQSEDLVKDYQYGAYGGLNGGVGFDIEILEFGIAEYNKTLFDLRTEIAGEGPVNPAPNKPGSPSPIDGATISGTSPTLSWNASDPDGDNLTYQVDLGTSSSPDQAANDLSTTSFDPGSLQSGTTYYWQVEVTDQDGATTEGPVWSFKTPSSESSGPDKIYSEDFSDDPQYEVLYRNVDEETEVYWDNSNGNYYAKVRDQYSDPWWALGKSPTFTTVGPNNTFTVSFKFNPVNPDWGHYPGISFVKSDPSSNPREISKSFTFKIRESGNYDRELSVTNSEGDSYSTPTIPAEDEWYDVKIKYNSGTETIDFSVVREDGSTFVDETGISILIYESFDQIMIGEDSGDGIKYGDQAQIRVDDIEITTGSE